MDIKHKYFDKQKTMIRWYYRLKDDGYKFIKRDLSDSNFSESVFFSLHKICLVTNFINNYCQLEYNDWIHKDFLIKLNNAPNGEKFGMPFYVNGSTSVIPSPGYHLLTNHPNCPDGYYYVFSLYDPYY